MTPTVLALVLVVLLVSPGPTNALVALGGASRGFFGALPLIGAVLAGYLLVVTPLALVGRPLLAGHPGLSTMVHIAAAFWVLWLAIQLWVPSADAGQSVSVSAGQVFVTTVVNPKGLVIGLTLLPATTLPGLLPWLLLLCATVVLTSGLWIAVGAALGRATAGRVPPLLRRGVAGLLGFFALGLAGSVL